MIPIFTRNVLGLEDRCVDTEDEAVDVQPDLGRDCHQPRLLLLLSFRLRRHVERALNEITGSLIAFDSNCILSEDVRYGGIGWERWVLIRDVPGSLVC